jgi:hypothetical protein
MLCTLYFLLGLTAGAWLACGAAAFAMLYGDHAGLRDRTFVGCACLALGPRALWLTVLDERDTHGSVLGNVRLNYEERLGESYQEGKRHGRLEAVNELLYSVTAIHDGVAIVRVEDRPSNGMPASPTDMPHSSDIPF